MEERKGLITANAKGNSDTITREYYDSLVIKERLIGSAEATTATRILGQDIATPIMTGAISGIDRFYEDGTVAMAEGVRKAGSIMWMGISEEEEIERAAATGVKLVEIIKPYAEEEKIFRKIEHARACGCIAVGMDIDHSFGADGRFGTDRFGNPMETKSVRQLHAYVEAAGDLPFIAKGILSAEDAVDAMEAGVKAIVLSHHHNIYPFAVPPIMVLPEIRAAVGEGMEIIVDSMIRDGNDVFKALALGADGVGVGRALQAVFAKGGADSAAQFIGEMTDQLRRIMSRTGSPDVKHIRAAMVVRR